MVVVAAAARPILVAVDSLASIHSWACFDESSHLIDLKAVSLCGCVWECKHDVMWEIALDSAGLGMMVDSSVSVSFAVGARI